MFIFIHHKRYNALNAVQPNKPNTTKENKKTVQQPHFHTQHLGPKHFTITSEMTEFRIKSGFAIMYTFIWQFKI